MGQAANVARKKGGMLLACGNAGRGSVSARSGSKRLQLNLGEEGEGFVGRARGERVRKDQGSNRRNRNAAGRSFREKRNNR